MSESITTSPIDNALDSLSRLEKCLGEAKRHEASALKVSLAWAWHVVEILAFLKMQRERESFDPWMQEYLVEGEPSLRIDRDAFWEVTRHLSLIELLDILSERDLSILKPDFYQGWQDRTSRCHELRDHLKNIVGNCLGEEPRNELLLLLAIHNRLIHVYADVVFEPRSAWEAFPALLDLIEMLAAGEEKTESEDLLKLIGNCRTHLK
jgi:hypothetical protein